MASMTQSKNMFLTFLLKMRPIISKANPNWTVKEVTEELGRLWEERQPTNDYCECGKYKYVGLSGSCLNNHKCTSESESDSESDSDYGYDP